MSCAKCVCARPYCKNKVSQSSWNISSGIENVLCDQLICRLLMNIMIGRSFYLSRSNTYWYDFHMPSDYLSIGSILFIQ